MTEAELLARAQSSLEQMPAADFVAEFKTAFMAEAVRQLGPVITPDRPAFFRIAREVLITMGEPTHAA